MKSILSFLLFLAVQSSGLASDDQAVLTHSPAFILLLGNSDAEALPSIHSRHEVYQNKHARLKEDVTTRINPPQPEKLTPNFWRSEKPATAAQGGTVR